MVKYIQENKLLFWLSIILLVISVLSIAVKIHFDINDEGILVNIATEIVGIIITIVFVSYIIDKNEKDKWKSAEKRVVNRIQHLVNETIALQNLAFSLESFRKPKENYINKDGNNIFIVYAENELLPKIDNLIRNIDGKTLDSFFYYLSQIESSVKKIFSEFGDKLSPFLFTKIYDIKDVLFYLIDTHRFHTKVHFIDSAKFLELYRAGDKIHNESVIKFIINNTQTMINIVIEIDKYLRDNYKYIEEKFPFMVDYRKTV